jgi:hypothetical protein
MRVGAIAPICLVTRAAVAYMKKLSDTGAVYLPSFGAANKTGRA